MPIPIGDDNSDRRITPIINYLLIAINIFVFIWWQQWGTNVPLTFAYATVPGEILTGTDLITQSQVLTDPYTGDQFEMPGLQATPVPVFLTPHHFPVFARRVGTLVWQYGIPLDIWR